ncbi:unnamed protein product [Ectocarpus sp. 12 AP-2014]
MVSFTNGRREKRLPYLRGLPAAMTCLALSSSRSCEGFVAPAGASVTRSALTKVHVSRTFPTEPLFAPDCAPERHDQDFPGLFPPVHRPLRLRDEDSEPMRGLWLFEQPLQTVPTVEMYSRMAVYALSDGSVCVYNPIAPTEETLQEINDAFGGPDHIIVPTTAWNNLLFVAGWAERFPRATFWGLEGVKLPGAKLTKDLTLESFPESWKAELDVSILEGNGIFRECFLLHRTTRSVFAMDSFVEMGEGNIPNPVLRAASKMSGNFGRPVCPTKSLLWDREKCKSAMSRVLDWDFDKVYANHGECPIQDAKEAIRGEFQFLWD